MAKKKDVDISAVERFASVGATREEVAHNLGISRKTFFLRCKENPDIEEAYERGKAKGVVLIENALFKRAKEGNVTAQIFFLKCHGWNENNSVELKGNLPLQLIIKNDLKE